MPKLARQIDSPNPRGVHLLSNKQSGIVIEQINISPSVARAWLDKNSDNRRKSPAIIAMYARDMAAGRWLMTGDPIRFGATGELLDGQHRLQACIEADTPFRSIVAYGLDGVAKDVIDSAKPRRGRDMLFMRGYHNTVILVTAAKWVLSYKAGHTRPNAVSPSHQELLAVVKANKSLPASCAIVRRALGPYPGLLAFIHAVAGQRYPKEADAFVDVFKTGTPSREDCPAHKLREFFIRERASDSSMKREQHYRTLVHAWNVFVEGETFSFRTIPKEVDIIGIERNKLRIK